MTQENSQKEEVVVEHTPGPWRAIDGAIVCERVNAYGNFLIASFGRGDEELTAEDIANAQLIAAAPETAAERDRLKELNAELVKATREGADFIAAALDSKSYDELGDFIANNAEDVEDRLRAALKKAEVALTEQGPEVRWCPLHEKEHFTVYKDGELWCYESNEKAGVA